MGLSAGVFLDAQPGAAAPQKRLTACLLHVKARIPWDGLTASLDMEPLASRFDSPRAATPTASLTFLFSHTWDSRRVLLQTPPDRQLNRRGPLYPLPVEVPVAIFYVGLSAGVFLDAQPGAAAPQKRLTACLLHVKAKSHGMASRPALTWSL